MKAKFLILIVVASLTLAAQASVFEIHAVEQNRSDKTTAYTIDNAGRKLTVNLNKEVMVDRTALVNAASIVETTGGKNDRRSVAELKLTFTNEGMRKVKEFATAHVGQELGVLIDDQLIATPVVRETPRGNSMTLSGNFSKAEADAMAAKINKGK